MNQPEDHPSSKPNASRAKLDEREKQDGVTDESLTGKLVVLATFDNSMDAHFFRNELDSHGIPARVNNEASTLMLGATIAGPSSAFWIEVVIRESDAEVGLEIKNQFNARSKNSREDSPVPEWTCGCGEVVDEGFAVCWNCGEDWSEE